VRACERALFVPEDFALEQRLWNRGAVHRHERKRRPRTELVDRLRNQFFPRARLAPDENGRRGRRRLLDDPIDGSNPGTAADDTPEAPLLAELATQLADFTQRLLSLDRLLQENLETLGIDGLAEVVVRPVLDGFHCTLDSPLRGQQDEGDVRKLIFECPQQILSAHPRHDKIADHDSWAKAGDLAHRVLPIAGLVGLESPGLNELGEAAARCGIILDDEHTLTTALRVVRIFHNDPASVPSSG
jgi:hypothetical protein